jgi:tRNA G26 N,N-dimethylase Trm1
LSIRLTIARLVTTKCLMSQSHEEALPRVIDWLDREAAKFVEDPEDALEWSEDEFYAAAFLRVHKIVRRALTDQNGSYTVQDARNHAIRAVLQTADERGSSSVTCTLMRRARTAAWVRVVRGLDEAGL